MLCPYLFSGEVQDQIFAQFLQGHFMFGVKSPFYLHICYKPQYITIIFVYLLFHHFCRTTFPCNKIKAMNMIKLHRTMHIYCTNVIFPVLILHYGYVRCNQRGTMSEGHARIYYHRDFPWLCNYLKINSFFFFER